MMESGYEVHPTRGAELVEAAPLETEEAPPDLVRCWLRTRCGCQTRLNLVGVVPQMIKVPLLYNDDFLSPPRPEEQQHRLFRLFGSTMMQSSVESEEKVTVWIYQESCQQERKLIEVPRGVIV